MKYIVVQAGGKGTRLGYLTKNKPKSLVSVDNLPILFHLFRKYPDKRFIIIADYKKEVLREYLSAFADVKYLIVDAEGTGTCAGIKQAIELLPEKEPFLLTWSDLILPMDFELPATYKADEQAVCEDYIGISETFPCRWSYQHGEFKEEQSCKHGVAGFFLFSSKEKLGGIPQNGELVRWMQQQKMKFKKISMTGTRECGVLEEYERLAQEKCRPFNRITVKDDILIKEPVDKQGENLAVRECEWYKKARERNVIGLPVIYSFKPLRMEYIYGKNIYECQMSHEEKRCILKKVIEMLLQLHELKKVPADYFSIKEAYFNKTMRRLSKVRDLVPFANERYICINGRKCRNVFFYKQELERKLEEISCTSFVFIHGDCTFSNIMLREDGTPVFIDPRGYFGHTELYGDVRYDWAKLYYSIVGNYDRFNLKDFQLEINSAEVILEIGSNHWEDMEEDFFVLTGADRDTIKLIHAVIWLSLTTYAWQDYDSICGAFYNGLYYLEEVL